jgi:hypothetical protein
VCSLTSGRDNIANSYILATSMFSQEKKGAIFQGGLIRLTAYRMLIF